MITVSIVASDPIAFDESLIECCRFRALESVYHDILVVDRENGTVERLMKFEPNKTCVMRRHTGPTKTFVLLGEQSSNRMKRAGSRIRHARLVVGRNAMATSEAA